MFTITTPARKSPWAGSCGRNKVDVVEGRGSARISGKPPSLFHQGSQDYIDLTVEGDTVSGYDYASEHHFAGRLIGFAVQIYDHETGRYHDFHVS